MSPLLILLAQVVGGVVVGFGLNVLAHKLLPNWGKTADEPRSK